MTGTTTPPHSGTDAANILTGIQGNDHLLGLGGDDWISGDSRDVLSAGTGLISVENTGPLYFAFAGSTTQMQHSVGMFTVDPSTGQLGPVTLLWEDGS
ncbi:MAG: hypothetical protein ACPGRD_01965, partial [Planktomarina sp.]